MRVVSLVPRRADNGRRDAVWAWVRDRWEREHPSWSIFEGDHDDGGPFNRSAAINTAAELAGEWDIAIVADSDSFVGPEQLAQAVELADEWGQMTLAYDNFQYLSRAMSDAVMSGYLGNWWEGVEWSMPGSCSSMVVVPRALWDEARGFDAGFVGWGMEDVAASHAFQTFGDGLQRVPGDVWHLHHPTQQRMDADHLRNVDRLRLYADASYHKPAMRMLIDRLRDEIAGGAPAEPPIEADLMFEPVPVGLPEGEQVPVVEPAPPGAQRPRRSSRATATKPAQ